MLLRINKKNSSIIPFPEQRSKLVCLLCACGVVEITSAEMAEEIYKYNSR